MPNEINGTWQQAGWATYAAIMLFGGGIVAIVNGIWALRYNEREADLVLAEKNLELWGTISLLGGILLLGAGIAVFYGKHWARWSGILLSVAAIVWSAGWAEVQQMQALIGTLIFMSVIFSLAISPVDVERTP